MNSLLPELLRHLIQFLPLTSLIAARGVNTTWRTLGLTASLHPARKTLLDLYLAAIVHPNFPSLVAALKPHVHQFDREAYIADLTSRGCVLPDLFELWILEWPSKAIHFWAWPGCSGHFQVAHEHYHDEINALAEKPPIIDTIPVPKTEAARVGNRTCKGLAIWEGAVSVELGLTQLWLVVDENERINDRRVGRLICTRSEFLDGDGYIPGPRKVVYDTPIGPATNFKLTDFLDMLDVSRKQLEAVLERLVDEGISQTDEEE